MDAREIPGPAIMRDGAGREYRVSVSFCGSLLISSAGAEHPTAESIAAALPDHVAAAAALRAGLEAAREAGRLDAQQEAAELEADQRAEILRVDRLASDLDAQAEAADRRSESIANEVEQLRSDHLQRLEAMLESL